MRQLKDRNDPIGPVFFFACASLDHSDNQQSEIGPMTTTLHNTDSAK